jgi:hypothetical protein
MKYRKIAAEKFNWRRVLWVLLMTVVHKIACLLFLDSPLKLSLMYVLVICVRSEWCSLDCICKQSSLSRKFTFTDTVRKEKFRYAGRCFPEGQCSLIIKIENMEIVGSIGFWRWCITHRIAGVLDFIHRPDLIVTRIKKNKHDVSETGSVSVLR